jgi:hypothetical protein
MEKNISLLPGPPSATWARSPRGTPRVQAGDPAVDELFRIRRPGELFGDSSLVK